MNISSFSQAEDEEEEEQQDYPGNDEAVQQNAEENNQGINIFLKKTFSFLEKGTVPAAKSTRTETFGRKSVPSFN